MTPSRPYLLRALYEWLMDNNATPYVLINALHKDVMVPQDYVTDGKIVLNIMHGIVSNLEITNDAISFQARFGGIPQYIYAPISAVLAIYSKENGRGMVFPEEEYSFANLEGAFEEDFGEESFADNTEEDGGDGGDGALELTKNNKSSQHETKNSTKEPQKPSKKGKPFLHIVK